MYHCRKLSLLQNVTARTIDLCKRKYHVLYSVNRLSIQSNTNELYSFTMILFQFFESDYLHSWFIKRQTFETYNNYCNCLSTWAYHQHSVVRDVYIIHTNNLLDILELYTVYFRMNYIILGLGTSWFDDIFWIGRICLRQNPTICVL